MAAYRSVNPVTGEVLREYPTATDEQIAEVLDRSYTAYRSWRKVPVAQRAEIISRAADLFESQADELAADVTAEMGKTISGAKAELKNVSNIFRYYAENAEQLLAPERIEVAGSGTARVRFDPIGPLVGIMPWNFPHYQTVRFAAPNLMLGNTIIVKHASNTPTSAANFERILLEAGLPEDAYINVFATHDQVATMIADDRVRGVSLTGSERAGAITGETAGRHIKPVVLELGGSDPYLVLADADLDKAVQDAIPGRLFNNGQTCTASKRFIVVDEVYEEFVRRFSETMAALEPGDPNDPNTVLGPLAFESAVSEMEAFVEDAVAHGATVTAGGKRVAGQRAYFEATVLTDVTPEARAYREEIFGPVAVVYRAADVDEAIEIANDSPFGLSSSVYTASNETAQYVAAELETGMVWFNSISRSSPELPFGGVKRSGIGRELGRPGIIQFANQKLVRDPHEEQ